MGPLRDSQVANFVGFVSTISLLIILTACLIIYGFVTFSKNSDNNETIEVDFLTRKGWRQFTSGFIVGGFGGAGIAYVFLKLINFDINPFKKGFNLLIFYLTFVRVFLIPCGIIY